jgi:predicted RND superfamily exporter protein
VAGLAAANINDVVRIIPIFGDLQLLIRRLLLIFFRSWPRSFFSLFSIFLALCDNEFIG